ncbi:MAG: hypothetical protein ACRERC_17265 [Candidatus Binatia bacterium]
MKNVCQFKISRPHLGWLAVACGLLPALAAVSAADNPPPAAPLPTSTAASQLGAPVLRAEAIGPTLVRVVAETQPADRVYSIRGMRTDAQGRTSPFSLNGRSDEDHHWQATDSAEPDTTYRYRAYAQSGTTTLRDSDSSNEVSVHTPPAPADPPAAPTGLRGHPAGPFRIELEWRDQSDNEYGFEIRKRTGEEWVRVLLVDPGVTRATVHGRPPDAAATYRVRAFNVRGASADSNDATVRTQPLSDTPPASRGKPPATPGPCRVREQVIADMQADGDGEVGAKPDEYPLRIADLGTSLGLLLLAHPVTCGNANCSWLIFGTHQGCFRQLGMAGGAGQMVVGTTPAGLPVLVDIGHGSASYSGAVLMQLVDGGFVEIDSYGHCAASDTDLRQLTPPFQDCQEDDDLWW